MIVGIVTEWMGVSQTIWEVSFAIMRYSIVALVAAYMVQVYIMQKDIVQDIKVDALRHRLEAYKEINRWISQVKCITPPPIHLQIVYADVMNGYAFKLDEQELEYSSFFSTQKSLLEFFDEFQRIMRKYKIYLDAIVEDKFGEFESWITDMLIIYKGFCDTEADARWHFSNQEVENRCSFAAQLLGIVLQHDVNKFYKQINRLVCERIQKIQLGKNVPWHFSFIKKRMIVYCEAQMEQDGILPACCRWIYYHWLYPTYGCSQLLQHSGDLALLFANVHYGECLFSEKRYAMNSEEYLNYIEPFRQCLAEKMSE